MPFYLVSTVYIVPKHQQHHKHFLHTSHVKVVCTHCHVHSLSISVGPPLAPNNVIISGSTILWSSSAPGLSHRIIVCFEDAAECPFLASCFGCNAYAITEISESCHYRITVCSSNVVNGVPCTSEACSSITTSM